MTRRTQLGLFITLIVAAALLWFRPWQPLLHGTVAPPEPATPVTDPCLAERIESALEAVRRSAYDDEVWGELGGVYDVHDFTDDAIACYERCSALDPDDFRWPYFRGVLTRIGDQERALSELSDARNLRDDYAPIHVYLGEGLVRTGKLEEAERAFRDAVNLDGTLVRAHIGLAKVALARDDPKSALQHLDVAMSASPRSDEPERLAAECRRRLGETSTPTTKKPGAPHLEPLPDPLRETLVTDYGASLALRRERSRKLLGAGQSDAAIALWQEGQRCHRDSSEMARGLGDAYFAASNWRQALDQYRRATDLEPTNGGAWLGVGNANLRLGAVDRAIPALEKALEHDPNLHEAKGNLGSVLVGSGDVPRGLRLLRESAAGLATNADAWFNLAMACIRVGNPDDAEGAFEEALRVDPSHHQGRFEYATYLGKKGDYAAAAEHLRKVVKAVPARTGAHINLAHTLASAGDYRGAVGACEEGRRHHPADPSLANRLAWLLATAPDESVRDGERALAVARALDESRPGDSPVHLQTLAAAYAEVGNFTLAEDAAGKALSIVLERQATPSGYPDDFLTGFAERLRAQIDGYRRKRPHRTGPSTP